MHLGRTSLLLGLLLYGIISSGILMCQGGDGHNEVYVELLDGNRDILGSALHCRRLAGAHGDLHLAPCAAPIALDPIPTLLLQTSVQAPNLHRIIELLHQCRSDGARFPATALHKRMSPYEGVGIASHLSRGSKGCAVIVAIRTENQDAEAMKKRRKAGERDASHMGASRLLGVAQHYTDWEQDHI
ncbi:uncharacterized protein MYCFIDRAFT_208833 [Pseudocercospora fijiensis CIRAD86]|uniref:Uncharacterized protein n=1 Tax=Pseudocercospora fijiensis (strain CIRAD86) TaxID=383855 RepID=M3AR38_PSEFD|nr:uncharacterized protein MYCFIDRAFT_208833 [Pseudocercospora fijiensis CIRAD86]EME79563.1 hypothetical protein MYCFIDRAFT_208833 [Pseudocercospora fijiensis CIRAD86]